MDELADRVKRINDLLDALMKAQHDSVTAHDLAVRIGEEIAAVREQIQQLPPPKTSPPVPRDDCRNCADHRRVVM